MVLLGMNATYLFLWPFNSMIFIFWVYSTMLNFFFCYKSTNTVISGSIEWSASRLVSPAVVFLLVVSVSAGKVLFGLSFV